MRDDRGRIGHAAGRVADTRRIAEVTIIWQGGATSTGTIQMNRPGAGHDHTLPDDTAELIGRLAQHYDDPTIAHILAQQRRTTGAGLRCAKLVKSAG